MVGRLLTYGLLFMFYMSIAGVAFLADSIMGFFGILDSYYGYQRLIASCVCGGIWGITIMAWVFWGSESKGENDKPAGKPI